LRLAEFIERIERERPDMIHLSDLANVHPKPWVLRAGSGGDARIRMLVGNVRYEREQGETVWHLAAVRSDFDTEAA
jgi:hypothetical protein